MRLQSCGGDAGVKVHGNVETDFASLQCTVTEEVIQDGSYPRPSHTTDSEETFSQGEEADVDASCSFTSFQPGFGTSLAQFHRGHNNVGWDGVSCFAESSESEDELCSELSVGIPASSEAGDSSVGDECGISCDCGSCEGDDFDGCIGLGNRTVIPGKCSEGVSWYSEARSCTFDSAASSGEQAFVCGSQEADYKASHKNNSKCPRTPVNKPRNNGFWFWLYTMKLLLLNPILLE